MWSFQKELKLPMAIRETTVQTWSILDLMCTVGMGIYCLRVETKVMIQTQQCLRPPRGLQTQWQIDTLFVADTRTLPQENATNVSLRWVSSTRAPDCCKNAVRSMQKKHLMTVCNLWISDYLVVVSMVVYDTALVGRWKVKPEKMLTSNSWKNVWLNTYQKSPIRTGCCLNRKLLLNHTLIAEQLSLKLPYLADIQVKEVNILNDQVR